MQLNLPRWGRAVHLQERSREESPAVSFPNPCAAIVFQASISARRPRSALHPSTPARSMQSPIPQDFAFFEGFDLPEPLRATAWRTSALKADSSTCSPSWMSIARRTFPSRLELKRPAGSLSDAPLAKVSFTTFLYDSPVQTMPSCDQTGVPGLFAF